MIDVGLCFLFSNIFNHTDEILVYGSVSIVKCLILLMSCKIQLFFSTCQTIYIFSGGAPARDGPDAAKGSPLAAQHEAQNSVPVAGPAPSQGQAQLNRSSSVGASQRGEGRFDNPHHTHFPPTDGPGQAVISEGGAGGRGAGPGEARVNGMPGKKSNSTSKLSAKG